MEDDNLQQYLASATLMIVVIGCLGNFLSLILFLRHSSSVNTLLAALSLVDLCLLLLAVPVFVMPSLDIWPDRTSLFNFLSCVLKFVYPVNLMFQTCSIYIMVLITIERWTAVCKPLQVRIWCTARTSRWALLCILIFAISYNLIRFWEYTIIETPEGLDYQRNLRDIHEHPYYVIFYYTGLYLLTHFLIPFSVIIIMNGHVCKQIIQLRRARLMLTRQQQREQSTTLMLLVVTLVFAVCNTLPFLLNLAECMKRDLFEAESTAWIAYQLNDLSNLLVVLNSSTTWIVYIIFSAKYRETAMRILWRCNTVYEKDVKYNSLSRTHSMRASSAMRKGGPVTSCTTESIRTLQSRSNRSNSECDDRIRKHVSSIISDKIKRDSKNNKSNGYRVSSHSKKEKTSSRLSLEVQPSTELLSPPPMTFRAPVPKWTEQTDRPEV
ncbi:unnamed protein product [Bursaphelenchus okinawaensis]|uniref:G-protein coupled receptors family 1 profile domain-containing protein n=1 Tax=Bursaphelenchus okinawaensis TaxID=465554 RepID=A0A811L7U7_9BILA|nr:unnamed protein product [Bursaphelenchus okinawaensis]CAG9118583.1 unnamed protein product [Bursaphelenchus okinawaensis]